VPCASPEGLAREGGQLGIGGEQHQTVQFGLGSRLHWDRLSRGERGLPAAAFIMQVLALAEQKAIDVRFDDHERFVNEVMTIDPVPYLKVVAVLHREA
jgi:hypothetical protein